MSVTALNAANAYASAARALDGSGQPDGGAAPLGDPGAFSDMVQAALGSVSQSGQAMEAQTADLAAGEADIVDLVTAVAESELAVETLVTVRDRVISAYQEILNMPI